MTRLRAICLIGVIAIAFLGITGWVSGYLPLTSFISGTKPIAPGAIFMLLLFCVVVAFASRKTPRSTPLFLATILVAMLYGLTTLILHIFPPTGHHAWLTFIYFPSADNLAAHTSPVASLDALVSGAILLLWLNGRQRGMTVAGWLALAIVVINITFVLAYLYGIPLLYGTPVIPIAFPACVAFLLLGFAIFSMLGPTVAPLCWFTDGTTRARLLATFLPFTVGILLLAVFTARVLPSLISINDAVLDTTTSVLFLCAAIVIISLASRRVGHDIDRARAERQRAEDALRDESERLLVTLRSIGDGVIVTDADGRIVLLNTVAETLTGWPQEEAVGQPITTIFRIVNEESHTPVDDPVRLVIASGIVVGLANHTALIARDGTERSIADSGAPIRDARGTIIGVVLVFRDVTHERKAESIKSLILRVLERLNRTGDNRELIGNIVEMIQQYVGVEAVGIRLRDGDDFPYYYTRGFSDDFIETERYLCARDTAGVILRDGNGVPIYECMCGNILSNRIDSAHSFFTEGGSFWSNCTTVLLASTTEADRQSPTRNRCNADGYESVALVPLRNGNQIIGLLQLNDRQRNCFSLELITLLEELGVSIGIALERAQINQALRESEARFRSLFENMLNGFAFCRMLYDQDEPVDFTYLAVNAAFGQLTGLTDVVGRKVSEVVPGIREADPVLFERYGRVARTGVQEQFETFVEALQMWFSISVYSPARDYFVAVFDVITARKRTEEALQFRNILLSTQQEASIDGILVVNADGMIISTNQRFTELWEIPARLFESESDSDDLQFVRETLVAPDEFIEKIHYLYAHPQETSQDEIALRDGRVLDRYSAPMLGEDGKYFGRVWYFRDITERKLAEEQLRQFTKMESVGRLAGGVAHDFNNLLTGIIGLTQLAQAEVAPTTRAHSDLNEVLALADRAANLTRQLLAFSRRQPIESRVLDINKLIEHLIKLLKRLIGEDISLTFHPSPDVDVVFADAGQLEQVLMNLAVNARDAMPSGGKLIIETANVELDQNYADAHLGTKPGKYALISVTDTGIGMDHAVQQHIFEPFFTTKEVGRGTGLGLATVYGIIKQHGGNIWVYSEPGQGTTFRIYLPRSNDSSTIEEHQISTSARLVGSETVLLVEDESAVRDVTCRILQDHGYTVLPAASPVEALDIFARYHEQIALLLTDVVMPGQNGFDLYDILALRNPAMKAIFMSGYSGAILPQTQPLPPGSAYIQKPFDPQALLRVIREILES